MLLLAGKRVLLLDADGVLRRLPDGEALEGLDRLEAFLREPEFSDVLVVAAGEWKRHLQPGQIRGLFSHDVRERFVGATPNIEGADRFRSHVEIHAWLDSHLEIASGVVLESGYYWQQFPALECAVFVPPRAVLGLGELDAVRGIFRSERVGSVTSQ